MKTLKHRFIILIFIFGFLLLNTFSFSQTTEYPFIGAQVFIEPGQTGEEIDQWFGMLKAHDMPVCRIRIFENHLQNKNGQWDFSLYDKAFKAAKKYDVKIFATLFPAVDAGNIGGFKFPKTKEHLQRIEKYIREVVLHYHNHSALYSWVLINEPGAGKAPVHESFTKSKFETWKKSLPPPKKHNGFRKDVMYEEMFLRYYNTWYLKWLANQVQKYDNQTPLHVNTHAIFQLLPEYNFSEWQPFLASLGASMHPSWHFGYFNRHQYTLAISANNNIVRSGAGKKPYWVTELQGGNNTYSALYPLCPTKQEIAQWLWTSVAHGAQGIIFWTLNPRATGYEAGEWGMITCQNHATDRLTMAGNVAKNIISNKELLKQAKPVFAPVYLLYTPEAMWVHNRFANAEDKYTARKPGAVVKSLLAFYQAFLENGIVPQIMEADDFDWKKTDYTNQTIIVPHQIALPQHLSNRFKHFVKNGGKLLFTGLTGYYDENCHHIMRSGFPYIDLFQAEMREVKLIADSFYCVNKLYNPSRLPAHLWQGELVTIPEDEETDSEVITNFQSAKYEKGKALWLPALIGLGAWHRNNTNLSEWLMNVCSNVDKSMPFTFDKQYKNVYLFTMKTGNNYITVLINKNKRRVECGLQLNETLDCNKHEIIFQLFDSEVGEKCRVTLAPEDVLVVKWNAKP